MAIFVVVVVFSALLCAIGGDGYVSLGVQCSGADIGFLQEGVDEGRFPSTNTSTKQENLFFLYIIINNNKQIDKSTKVMG